MPNEITFRPETAGLMAALSVAERLTGISPAAPTQLRVDSSDFDLVEVDGVYERPVGVLLYFHHSVDSVRAFAEVFGATVGEEQHPDDTTYTYADGVLDGVPFRAWTLLANEAAGDAAEVAA